MLDTGTSSDTYLLDVTIGVGGTLTSGSVTNLTSTPAISEGQPTWSPDGQWIAFNRAINGQSTLSKMQADGTGIQTLVSGAQTGSWSPDDQYLAYWASRTIPSGATSELFRIRVDGTGMTDIVNTDRVNERYPDWNPNWVNDLGSALTAVSTGYAANAATLNQGQVKPLFTEAIARWAGAGADTAALNGIQVVTADLPGPELGEAVNNTIYLDNNAAGWGWFVDKTPSDDSEYLTPGNQGEQNRMDLLTVLEHEVGHLLGYEHQTTGVMIDTLSAGTRGTPSGELTASPIGLWFSGVGKKKDSFLAAWLECADN